MLKRMQANASTREFTWDFMKARDNFLERLKVHLSHQVCLQSPNYMSIDNNNEITRALCQE